MAEEAISTQGRRSSQARRKPARRSDVWVHFTPFTDDDGNDKAQCKNCNQVLGASTRNGTSTLRAHVRICRGEEAAAAAAASSSRPCAPSHPHGSSDRESSGRKGTSRQLSPRPGSALAEEPGLEDQQAHHGPGLEDEEEASRDLARMIALGGHDPSVVEDEHFRSFVRRLNPGFKLPSREAIEEMCDHVFAESRDKAQHDLDLWKDAPDPGRISVGVRQAISMKGGEVLHTTFHYIDDKWKLHRVVMDACQVLSSPPLGQLCFVPSFFGAEVVTLDYAIEAVTMRIADEVDPDPDKLHYPFMVAGEIMGHVDLVKLKDCIERYFGEMGLTFGAYRPVICTTYMDHVLHSIARCLLPGSELVEEILDYMDWGQSQDDEDLLLSRLDLDEPLDNDEGWYWWYYFLVMIGKREQWTNRSEEKLLLNVWGEIYRAIKRVCAHSTPTSNLCLEELLNVRNVLQFQLSEASEGMSDNDFGIDEDADARLRKALETIDKEIEDSYLVWSIPLVLDPRYKLSHIEILFERAFGGSKAKNYISEVTRKIKELYTSYDQYRGLSDSTNDEMIAVDSTNPSEQARDELQCYLQDSPARRTNDFDILNWWKVYGSQYPTVARMARDALAMPTCSKLTSEQNAQVKGMLPRYIGPLYYFFRLLNKQLS